MYYEEYRFAIDYLVYVIEKNVESCYTVTRDITDRKGYMTLKILKKLFYIMAILIMMCCGGILVCALNPALTQKISTALYGEGMNRVWQNGSPSGTDVGTAGAGILQGEDDSSAGDSGIDWNKISVSPDQGYVPPESETLQTPQTVDGRSGYEQIKEQASQVGEQEAQLLQETLDTGETGEELTFSGEKYPYYVMLTEQMQSLYCQIYANALEMNDSFAPVTPVTVAQLKNVFEAVYNDHPELFWLETGYSCKYRPAGECMEITLKYNDTIYFFEQAELNFQSAAESILTVSSRLDSVQEKEKYVHDALTSLVEYDEKAAMNQSAYSALVNGRSVCAGYARAFQYLMQQMDIPCYYCTGYSGQDHAWNIVAMGDGFVNVDVTWDDTEPSTYDYYNKSDEEYSATHVRRGLSVYLPACGAYRETPDVMNLGDFLGR